MSYLTLQQLKANLDNAVSGRNLCLTPDLTDSGNIIAFLNTLPGKKLQINNVNIVFQDPALTVTGMLPDFWNVNGLPGASVTNLQLMLTFTSVSDSSPLSAALAVQGLVTVAGTPVALQGTLQTDNRVKFGLDDKDKGKIFSVKDMAGFATDDCLVSYLPEGEDLFGQTGLDSFMLNFGFDPSLPADISVTCDVNGDWVVVENLFTVKSVGVTLQSSVSVIEGQEDPSLFCSGNVHGTVHIGQDFDVSVSFSGMPVLVISVVPGDGNVLPGFLDIADLLGSDALKNEVSDALGVLGLDCFSIDRVDIAFDLKSKGLSYLAVYNHVMIRDLWINLYLQTGSGSSSGWFFSGTTLPGQTILIGDLLDYIAEKFCDAAVPESVKDMTIENLGLSFDTATKNFTFACEGTLPVDGKALNIKVFISLTNSQGKYSFDISASVIFGDMEFGVCFDKDPSSTLFVAYYDNNRSGDIVNVKDLAGYISDDLQDHAPDIEIQLKEVLFCYDKGNNSSTCLFGMDMGVDINLSNLPLVGKEFPQDQTISVEDLQFLIVPSDVPFSLAAAFNGVIPDNAAKLPDMDLKKGIVLSAGMKFGNTTDILSLEISGDTEKVLKASAGPPASGTAWFNLQKSFGPVYFERIGVQYQSGALWFLLDTSLLTSVLTISLEGLGVGSSLDDFDPQFSLSGLGLGFQSGPVSFSGGFLNVAPPPQDLSMEFNGEVLFGFENFTISGLGSYAVYKDGTPSLFLFAMLSEPLGGPPYFFVTGLAGGFGYNRSLKLPSPDKIMDFPFVQAALGKGALKSDSTPDQALQAMDQYISPCIGEYWLSAGIRFSTFELLNSFVLANAEFGTTFEVSLIGISSLDVPVKSPDVIVHAELGLEVSYVPENGVFEAAAALTQNSYILSQDCRLSGGFAFYMWFQGEHSGDFVVTLGGYPPSFQRPDHYPVEDRLGINWPVSSHIKIEGDGYFALTPSCVMAGGKLNAVYTLGNLQAWFCAYTDLLMDWKPFHYDIQVAVSLGASYCVKVCHVHHTFKVELGASLHVWGPEFSGSVHVSWYVISFTISFGSSPNSHPPKLGWQEFSDSFLPHSGTAACRGTDNAGPMVCSANVAKGLIKNLHQEGPPSCWIINPEDFVLCTNSVIPGTAMSFNNINIPLDGLNTAIGIRPMGSRNVTSVHAVLLEKRINNDWQTVPEGYLTTEGVAGNLPSAVWDNKDLSGPGAEMVENVPIGMKITPCPVPPYTVPSNGSISSGVFGYETLGLVIGWQDLTPPVNPVFPDTDSIIQLKQSIMNDQIIIKRKNILDFLAENNTEVDTEISVPLMAQNAENILDAPPLLFEEGAVPGNQGEKYG